MSLSRIHYLVELQHSQNLEQIIYPKKVHIASINPPSIYKPSQLPLLQLSQSQMHTLNRLTCQSPPKSNLLPRLRQLKTEHPKQPRNGTPELGFRKVLPNTRPWPMQERNLRKIRRRTTMFIRRLFSRLLICINPPLGEELVRCLAPELGVAVNGLRAEGDGSALGDFLSRNSGFANGFAACHGYCWVQA